MRIILFVVCLFIGMFSVYYPYVSINIHTKITHPALNLNAVCFGDLTECFVKQRHLLKGLQCNAWTDIDHSFIPNKTWPCLQCTVVLCGAQKIAQIKRIQTGPYFLCKSLAFCPKSQQQLLSILENAEWYSSDGRKLFMDFFP
jgi:hypothetical protein